MAARLRATSLLLAALLAASAAGALGRALLQGSTKVGLWADEPEPMKSFDKAVEARVDELASLSATVVPLPNLDDRITALENGTVDWVVAAFSVTPDRAKLVDFVLPYYFSAGAALFAPQGNAAGITSWEGVRGKKLASLTEAVDLVNKGEAVAAVYDSTTVSPGGGLTQVAGIPLLLPTPMGIAVKKGNTQLADKISAALTNMATGGASSDLAMYEQKYFVSQGAQPNPDLAALLADPASKTTMLGKAIA
ncbi:hypothetical protein ABPG75_000434 [Micractinium tetrahymenae]